MHQNENTIIETERLLLRRFTKADQDAHAKMWTQPDFYRYLLNGKGIEPQQARNMVTDYAFKRGMFAVVEKGSGKLIGNCGIVPIRDGRIELDYAYDPAYWGNGYATEAARAIVDYAKADPEVDSLIAMAFPENTASINVFKKLGFHRLEQETHYGSTLEVWTLDL